MTLGEAASSGVVQGVTEFLPISSSGHLVLLHGLFGFQEPRLLFDLWLHVGSLGAVGIFYWRRILRLFQEFRQLGFLVIGTVPAVFGGLFWGGALEQLFREPKAVGGGFLITAVWLWVGERFQAGRKRELNGWSALLIGISQGIALVPGISRSGMTIATGLLLGLEGKRAVEFSFLLLFPAVLGGFCYKLFGQGSSGEVAFLGREMPHFLIGGGLAMGVGMLALSALERVVERRKLSFFSLYLVAVGLLTLGMSG